MVGTVLARLTSSPKCHSQKEATVTEKPGAWFRESVRELERKKVLKRLTHKKWKKGEDGGS